MIYDAYTIYISDKLAVKKIDSHRDEDPFILICGIFCPYPVRGFSNGDASEMCTSLSILAIAFEFILFESWQHSKRNFSLLFHD